MTCIPARDPRRPGRGLQRACRALAEGERVAQDRRDGGAARYVVTADRQHPAAGEPHTTGDLVNDAIAVRSGLPERDRTVRWSTEPGTTSSMSTSTVSIAPYVAARATSAMSDSVRPSEDRRP